MTKYPLQTAYTFQKKLDLFTTYTWDPDFTKVTLEKERQLDQADAEMANGQYYTKEEVWEK